jgi:hypothetical protein
MKTETLIIKSKIMINIDDIKDVQGLEYKKQPDNVSPIVKEENTLSDKYVVRVFSRTPFIDLLCDDIETAKFLYKSILKSRSVVNINEMRYGK